MTIRYDGLLKLASAIVVQACKDTKRRDEYARSWLLSPTGEFFCDTLDLDYDAVKRFAKRGTYPHQPADAGHNPNPFLEAHMSDQPTNTYDYTADLEKLDPEAKRQLDLLIAQAIPGLQRDQDARSKAGLKVQYQAEIKPHRGNVRKVSDIQRKYRGLGLTDFT